MENSVRSVPLDPPVRPKYYYIPAVWVEVIDTLSAHGIPMEVLTEEVTVEGVHHYRMFDVTWPKLREGRATASGSWTSETCTRTYRPNDVRISTDHPLGTLAVALLEPRGEQSFFFYGFFNSVFYQNEHNENYIMIPIAERLVADVPDIASAWDLYVTENPTYGESDVRDFFFPYTAFYDTEALLYPIGIVYADDDTDEVEPTSSPNDDVVVPTDAPSSSSSAAVGRLSSSIFVLNGRPSVDSMWMFTKLIDLVWSNYGMLLTFLLPVSISFVSF